MKNPVLFFLSLLILLQFTACSSGTQALPSPGKIYETNVVQPAEEKIFREKRFTLGLAETPEQQTELKMIQKAVGTKMKFRIRRCSVSELSGLLRSGEIDLAAGNLPEDRIRQLRLVPVLSYDTKTSRNALAVRRGSVRLKNFLEGIEK